MKNKNFYSVQDWLPFKKIFDNGIIQLKDNSFIKILKVFPINYDLKSELEKEAILNSYKIFLKTCNFNLQILIQSNKRDLTKHILQIKEKSKDNKELAEKYIEYIQELNQKKMTNSKNFFILIKEKMETENINNQKIIFQKLNENFSKIKENLSRCGNSVKEINNNKEMLKLIYLFLNYK